VRQRVSLLAGVFLMVSLSVVFSAPASGQVQRQVIVGEQLAAWLQQSDVPGPGSFTGFVLGVHDAFNEIMFCTSRDVDNQQIEMAVSDFLNAHPEMLHKSGADLVRQAFAGAFPCRQ